MARRAAARYSSRVKLPSSPGRWGSGYARTGVTAGAEGRRAGNVVGRLNRSRTSRRRAAARRGGRGGAVEEDQVGQVGEPAGGRPRLEAGRQFLDEGRAGRTQGARTGRSVMLPLLVLGRHAPAFPPLPSFYAGATPPAPS